METLKPLILGWSIVWAASLVAAHPGAGPIVLIEFFKLSSNGFAIYAPLYILGVWLLGCIFIVLFVRLFRKLWVK